MEGSLSFTKYLITLLRLTRKLEAKTILDLMEASLKTLKQELWFCPVCTSRLDNFFSFSGLGLLVD
jgi:hypothetical protein